MPLSPPAPQQQPGETLWQARSSGALLEAAAISGAIFDGGQWLRNRYPASNTGTPLAATALVLDIALKEPDWLEADLRGRGVPRSMNWIPIITLPQIMIDAANAMVTVPGEFLSIGHGYRADTARMVQAAYHMLAVADEQMARTEQVLRELEMERSARIEAKTADTAPPSPAQRVGRMSSPAFRWHSRGRGARSGLQALCSIGSAVRKGPSSSDRQQWPCVCRAAGVAVLREHVVQSAN